MVTTILRMHQATLVFTDITTIYICEYPSKDAERDVRACARYNRKRLSPTKRNEEQKEKH